MKVLSLTITALMLALQSQALHFYIKHGERRCFYEELPVDTLVVAKFDASMYDESMRDWVKPSDLTFDLTVDETFDNDHRVVAQRSSTFGEFTFTSLDSGEHKFCFQPHFKRDQKQRIRVFLDVAIGRSNTIDSKRMDEVGYLMYTIGELNQKTEEVKREHSNIREREASFRDQSESTNVRIVRWTLFQIVLLLGIGLWQIKHLKSFFIKQKIV